MHCFILVWSALIFEILSSKNILSLLLFFSTKGFVIEMTSSNNSFNSNSSFTSSNFSASILDKSKTSLINCNRCRPERSIFLTSSI